MASQKNLRSHFFNFYFSCFHDKIHIMKSQLKNDKYKKSRGGYSRFLQIVCASCSKEIAIYQKDGSGILKRMYLDRISDSKYSKQESFPVKKVLPFVCLNNKCNKVLGVVINYEKENRLAYRLFVGVIAKKILKSN